MNKDEKKERFIELRIKGETFQTITDELQISKQTLINWSKETNVHETITTAKLMKYQNILKTQEMNREAQIEYFSKLIKKCKEEMLTRDVSSIPTERLLNLIIKGNEELMKTVPSFNYCDRTFEIDAFGTNFYFKPED